MILMPDQALQPTVRGVELWRRLPMRSLFPLIISLLCAGCGQEPAPAPIPWVVAPPDFKVGDLDKNGRLIFWSINAFDHMEPFVLHEDDYGTVLYNDGTYDRPAARYILAFQNTCEIVHTSDFAEFKRALAKVPRGSAIGLFDTCSVPRTAGLPEAVTAQFKKALSDAGLRVIDTRGVCYCPNEK